MMLTYLALLGMAQVNETLASFEDYMKRASSLSVTMTIRNGLNPEEATGRYFLRRPDEQLWVMKSPNSDYSFAQSDTGLLEIENMQRLYHHYEPVSYLAEPESTLSTLPGMGFPRALVTGTLRSIVPRGVNFTPVGSSPEEDGSSTLAATFFNGMSMLEVKINVAKDGKLLWQQTGAQGMPAERAVLIKYSDYNLRPTYPSGAFALKLPKGYMPEILEETFTPANVGTQAPFKGLAKLNGSAVDVITSLGKKTSLVVVAGSNCEPSMSLLKSVAKWAPQIEKKGAKIGVIWTEQKRASGAPTGFAEFYDPHGSAMKRFNTQFTPLFVMVAPNGVIKQVWQGYDTAIAGRYEKEILDAVSAPVPKQDQE